MEEFESEFAAFQAEIEALAPEEDASADNKPLPPPPMPPPSHAPPAAAYDPYAAAYSAETTAKPADPKKVQVVYGSAAVIQRKPDGSAAAPPKKKAKKAPPGFDQKAKKRKKSAKAAAPTVALPPKMVEEKEKEKASKVVDAVVSKPPVLPEPAKEEPAEPVFKTWTGVDPEAPSISDAGRKAVEANQNRVYLRKAAGKIWNDMSLAEWPDNDFRIFVGDLGNEVNDNTLAKVFVKYTSFAKAKVIRDKRTQKTKGYGFVSFLDPFDAVTALKEMQGCYVGNRPIKLRKSKWGDRTYTPKAKRKNHTY